MARDAIATCPICQGELAITRLHCRECGTSLEGDFNVGRFARLGRDQFSLLESFLRSRGNLKEMERELGISYPTVRARVETLMRALGLDTSPAESEARPGEDVTVPLSRADTASATADEIATARREILERLARREIDPVAAAAQLRALGG